MMPRVVMSPSSLLPIVLSVLLLAVVGGVAGYSGKVLLVSMDGFRWDYIHKVSGLGNFSRLADTGCSVDYVNNTFITKTFPCHYTIVTGLYEESHGIVANHMYDPTRDATFRMASKESFWWDGGEPVWVTAEKHGKSSAVFFWPGSEVKIRGYRPSIYKDYDQSVPFAERVETAVRWFSEDHKDFVAIYFHQPDHAGHKHGPDSPEVVREMDAVLGLILDTLEAKQLTDVVNVIITSDHGMTNVNMESRLINFWDYFNETMIEKLPDVGPATAILPAAGWEDEVVRVARTIDHVTVYRKEEMPERFHYKNNPRIMPVLIMADEGWVVSKNVTRSRQWNGKGSHGYSNELQSMKPIFFARGPDFRKGAKSTSILSVDIYPLVCRLLNIEAAPNNGSLERTAQFLVEGAPTPSDLIG